MNKLVKGYDYLGMIKEKQKLYKEACSAYEKAWEYSNKNSAHMGYDIDLDLNSPKAI